MIDKSTWKVNVSYSLFQCARSLCSIVRRNECTLRFLHSITRTLWFALWSRVKYFLKVEFCIIHSFNYIIHVKVNFNGWHETPSSLLMIFKIRIFNKWANWNACSGPLPSNANKKMAKCDKGQTHTHESFMHDLQLIIKHLSKWFYVGNLVNMWLVA